MSEQWLNQSAVQATLLEVLGKVGRCALTRRPGKYLARPLHDAPTMIRLMDRKAGLVKIQIKLIYGGVETCRSWNVIYAE
ncbi:MAG: hypothetical protein JOZ29_14400 [Deltaproteobacteria bacterium]|nr:hypothetical protein [Deltaproteobacteria bacterium]MBV8453440.1 hypothetical protein [Deltaproteobacteria bacterium]